MYGPNNRDTKYVKQKLIQMKGEIDKSTVKIGDFNSPLSKIDETTRQKISKEIIKLNNTAN